MGRVLEMSISVDYEDMKTTAEGYRALADDLRAAPPTGLPTGVGVYGYPVLAVAVDRMVDALGDRHDALVTSTDSIATRLDLCRRAYEAVDRVRAEALEAVNRVVDGLRDMLGRVADRRDSTGAATRGGNDSGGAQ